MVVSREFVHLLADSHECLILRRRILRSFVSRDDDGDSPVRGVSDCVDHRGHFERANTILVRHRFPKEDDWHGGVNVHEARKARHPGTAPMARHHRLERERGG